MGSKGQKELREEVAIIGMAGRFPGAKNIDEFWQNLRDGIESIVAFSEEDIRASGMDPAILKDPSYVNAGAVMPDADLFDASFFGYTPREAEIMDPQHRAFLECSWEALENAGYDPETYDGMIGIYGGVARNTYFWNNLAPHQDLMRAAGAYQTMISNEKDFPVTRVSYKLNLRGPGINVQTACSTSGVALHLACQSLLSGECDMALVGGARVQSPLKAGYFYQEGGILSPDGHCRAFDAKARGTVIGNGIAMVVVKRLSEAIEDRDSIHAIIKGTAINNDGSVKIGFTAPGVEGQSRAIAEALAVAEVDADTINYVEAHGTGTTIGDPIEVSALTKAFQQTTKKRGYCAIGSVKTNIGHLDAGAGVVGLIKTVLSMKNGLIPPSLNFDSPNPQIDFSNSPFYVNARLSEWKAGETPRRAGISSFGLGGTNAHIVIEEAPQPEPSEVSRPWQLLVLSAKSPSALDATTKNLAEFLKKNEVNLADVAYTLQLGRRPFNHRRIAVCQDSHDAAAVLESQDPRRLITQKQDRKEIPVVFMFPGGGAQYPGMAYELYQQEPLFRSLMDQCFLYLKSHLGLDLRNLVYPAADRMEQAAEQMTKTTFALPALFSIEYCIAKLLMSWGVQPTAMIGHSLGEYTAACVAGVLSLEDALSLVTLRGRLFEQLPEGGMLSVPLPEQEVISLNVNGISIAASNRPSLCVASGSVKSIEQLEKLLTSKGIDSSRLHINVAAHSPMVEPILEEFAAFLRKIRLNTPEIPYVSNVTGTWIKSDKATDPEYWIRHLRQTVRFSDGLQLLLQDSTRFFLEVGPGQTLCTFARQHPDRKNEHGVLATLRHPKEQTSDVAFLMNTIGRLWLVGATVDWSAFYGNEKRRRIGLPTYPFERKRFWIDPPVSVINPDLTAGAAQGTISHNTTLYERIDSSVPEMREGISMTQSQVNLNTGSSRKDRVLAILKGIIHELSGLDPAELDVNATFLELGFESLFLTQATGEFQNKLDVKITFRQLFEETPTLDSLAAYVDGQLPAGALADEQPAAIPMPVATAVQQQQLPTMVTEMFQLPQTGFVGNSVLERILAQQLQLMAAQLQILRSGGAGTEIHMPAPVSDFQTSKSLETVTKAASEQNVQAPAKKQDAKNFGPWKPIEKGVGGGFTSRQQKHLDALIARFTARTKESKRQTQEHRKALADPRTVAGFRLAWKEMVYPIVISRSYGSKLWDVDGNEWIDITMGFGVSLFGHSPDFVVKAVQEQLKDNMSIGPQSPLAGKVAELISEFTGLERVAFCNTGSEAVLAALRVSRTVTGKNRIAMFSGDYHGIFDEVLVRGINVNGKRKSVPVAPGIPNRAVEDVLVLDYGNPESLDVIRSQAKELAAVVVEPVQSRRPDLQPKEFLQSLRALTKELRIPLIFDEMITGFRLHPGGAQAWFGVQADIAAYGKVIGGGMPIGVVAGKAEYMDALDGGKWNFGDSSVPEAGVTWFAGTFVRHPLTLAAAWAVLNHLKEQGPRLQEELNEKTTRFAREMNDFFEKEQFPIRIVHFSSFFLINFSGDHEYSGLFWHHLRDKGVHTHEGRPNFLTTAHTEQDMEFLVRVFQEAAIEMREGGFLGDAEIAHARKSPDAAYEMPITQEQLELWLGCQYGHDLSCGFNLSYSMYFKGDFQMDAMRKAFQQLIHRHDSLRMTISSEGETLRFSPTVNMEIPIYDFSALDEQERKVKIEQLLSEELETAYDLTNGPLVRVQIAKLTSNYHFVLFGVHHIASDGFSAGILMRELGALYTAACTGSNANLPEPMQYSEYAEWEHQQKSTPEFEQAEKYWIGLCSDPLPPPLNLPSDRKRPVLKTFRSTAHFAKLEKGLTSDLKRIGAKRGCSVFSTLLAGFTVWLHRLTNQDDVVVGIPASGQSMVGRNDLVGHCAHHHPFRSRIRWDDKASGHMKKVQKGVLDAYEHRNYTEGTLLKKLTFPRDPSRFALINIQFNMDPAPLLAKFQGLESDISFNGRHYNAPDITFNLVESNGEIQIRCEYNTDLFDALTMERWLRHFETVLQSIVNNPDQVISEVPLLTTGEQKQLLQEWNKTEADYPQQLTVHQLFEKQAENQPGSVAVVLDDQQLTYGELNSRSNQLAHYLKKAGVGPGVTVGIFMDRSLEMIVGMLGTLKTGGTYVPLDPVYPKQRLAFLIQDTNAPIVLTLNSLLNSLPPTKAKLVCVDSDWKTIAKEASTNVPNKSSSESIAYVMYTSGSTGKPKGVEIPHRGIIRLLFGVNYVSLDEKQSILQMASVSFDASTFEIWGALLHGGRCILYPQRIPTIEGIRAVIQKHNISILWLTSSLFNLVVDEAPEILARIGQLLVGGEALSVSHVKRALQSLASTQITNGYGPTESTTFACCFEIPRELEKSTESIPIGRSISNTAVFLLDKNLNVVPVGVPGELFIGGDGLAHGYLNQPEITAEKFIPHPFSLKPGARLYKTGDLARYLPNGNVEFLGRLDHQMKLRGFRIEPGEIELALRQYQGVNEAAVGLREDIPDNKRLVAYVTATEGVTLKPTEIRNYLKGQVPDYMVPSTIVVLDSMPLTPNGKIDRQALLVPEQMLPDREVNYVSAGTETEKMIANVWSEVLGVKKVGIHDDFFELGGHSLLATQVISRLRGLFHIELTLNRFFELSTIAELAETIEIAGNNGGGELVSPAIAPLSRESHRAKRNTMNE